MVKNRKRISTSAFIPLPVKETRLRLPPRNAGVVPFGSLDDIPFESLAPQAIRSREVTGVWIVWLTAAGARHQHARRVVDDTCCRNVAEFLQPLYRILQLILGPQIARFDVRLWQVAEFHQIVLLQSERQICSMLIV